MPKHIFKTFLKENFVETDKISLKQISLFYGSAGSGKTFEIDNLFNKYSGYVLYIGRTFEEEIYLNKFNEVKVDKLNKRRMFLWFKRK